MTHTQKTFTLSISRESEFGSSTVSSEFHCDHAGSLFDLLRFFEAAPFMLEALILIDAYLCATDASNSNEARIVRAAIAKARGGGE